MNPAGELVLKLVLTPVLVGAASLAGRRWGPGVSGWLIGIPFTSGPIAFFLALSPGGRFAQDAAAGIMAGAASQAVFCLAYGWTARRAGWPGSLLGATVAFGVSTFILSSVSLPVLSSFVLIIVVIVVVLFLMPSASPAAAPPPTRHGAARTARSARFASYVPHHVGRTHYTRWDIPARMAIATAFVLALTSAAPLLGARLAGLIAPFPLYASVLAVFAHRALGGGAATGVVRGLLLGLFAFAAFFLAVATLLPRGIALAFAIAILIALAVQATSLVAGRRFGLA